MAPLSLPSLCPTMRALLAALLLATPVLAQSTPEEPPPAPPPVQAQAIDPSLVGTWELDETVDLGFLGRMDVEVQAMRCVFRADGTADVAMTVEQDQDTTATAKTFGFSTEDGTIVTDTDDQPVRYQILEDGRLEIRDPMGLVVRLAPVTE